LFFSDTKESPFFLPYQHPTIVDMQYVSHVERAVASAMCHASVFDRVVGFRLLGFGSKRCSQKHHEFTEFYVKHFETGKFDPAWNYHLSMPFNTIQPMIKMRCFAFG